MIAGSGLLNATPGDRARRISPSSRLNTGTKMPRLMFFRRLGPQPASVFNSLAREHARLMMSRTPAFRVVGPLAIAAVLGAILGPGLARSQVGAEAQPQPEQPPANRATTGRDAADASRPGQSADEPGI